MDPEVEAAQEARALNEQLHAAYQQGHMEEARALAQQVVDTYRSATEASLEAQLDYAMYLLAHFCYVEGEGAAGLALTLELYDRWKTGLETDRLGAEAGYLLTLAQDLMGAMEFEDALELYRLIGERLDSASEPVLRQPRALALAGEVGVLGQLDRIPEAQEAATRLADDYGEDALAAYDEQLARLDVSQGSSGQRALRALALFNKAGVLMNLGRTEEAAVLFTAIVVQYENEKRGDVWAIVTQARETLRALDD